MGWGKFAICIKCGNYQHSIGNHANVFSQVCDRCGEQHWETMVVAREVFIGKWWNPLTWFDMKLKRK